MIEQHDKCSLHEKENLITSLKGIFEKKNPDKKQIKKTKNKKYKTKQKTNKKNNKKKKERKRY